MMRDVVNHVTTSLDHLSFHLLVIDKRGVTATGGMYRLEATAANHAAYYNYCAYVWFKG